MVDVLIAGGGPAGSLAALFLARGGARVVVVDREVFPRDKLCGDTLNPGAVAFLLAAGLSGGPLDGAARLTGIRLTGPSVQVDGVYPNGQTGLAVTRRDLDWWLLQAAIRAGVHFESGLVVRGPLIDGARGGLVRGLVLSRRRGGGEVRMPATVVIAADGRRSVLARALGLRRDPPTVRRWAFGAYVRGVDDVGALGEMHVRHGWYLGLAGLAGGIVNVCVVTPPRPSGRSPRDVIRETVARDPTLARRIAGAEFVSEVRVLGPLAADVSHPGAPGLLLAGDAAGFVDPMTGDGLHLAFQGARLAASEALRVLETGDFSGAPGRLADARAAALGPKLRFNRWMRRVAAMPLAIEAASAGARLWPQALRAAVRYAGDAR